MSNETKYLGLREWAAIAFDTPPAIHDLRRMARDGRIQPPPFIIGRSFYVHAGAEFHPRAPGSPTAPQSTALYRHFDALGTLLYVGISLCAITRLMSHERASPWFSDIATITVQHFPTRELALAAEARAIADEHPLHNIAGKPRWKLADSIDDAVEIKKVDRFLESKAAA